MLLKLDVRKYKDFQDFMSDQDRMGFYAFNFTNGKLKKDWPDKYEEYLQTQEKNGKDMREVRRRDKRRQAKSIRVRKGSL